MFTDGISDIGTKLLAGSSLPQNQNLQQSLILSNNSSNI